MDAIIFIVLLVIVICFFRRFSNVVFFVAIFDIFLRILTFLKYNTVKEIKTFIAKYFPVNLSLLKHKIFANHCKMVIFLSNLTFCYCVRFVRLI